ncbi:MAG: dephospho-CoA kinase [Ruminococcus sp.]|nr:dephospho-CoA kinase [Ruminococcus sp.]
MISLDVLVVGLTGQTGAGKSTVSKVFSDNGFAIINADLISRKVVEKGTKCLEEIVDIFKAGILNSDGTLNRKALGNIVFTDKTKLEMLNTIIYPYITSEILNEIKHLSDSGKKLVLLDAPTLFESHADDFCEIIISVLSDEEIREERIIKRDGLTKKQANDRMNSQLDAEYFASHSDYVIENNDTLESLSSISKEVSDKIKYYYYHIRSSEMSVQ